MSGFFSMDGPFYKIGSFIADIMILSFYWLIFSIPLFTIGASTTALYYVMTRRISNREGYLFRDFWTSFKSNFKQTTIIWLIFVALFYILYININLVRDPNSVQILGNMRTVVYPVQICILIEAILCLIYIFPLNARFEMRLKDSFKTAFFMANRHLLTSIGCLIVAAAIVIATMMTYILFLVAMGLYVFLTSYLLLRIFKKYRPEIDQDPMLMDNQAISVEPEVSESAVETIGGLDDRSRQTER